VTWEELGGLGSFAGGFGVLITVIYGVFEYRRHRRELEMQAAFDGESGWSEFCLAISMNPAVALASIRGLTEEESAFTAEERAQLSFGTRAFFHRLEAEWYLSKQRGLPADTWSKRRIWCRAYIETPIGRIAWERQRDSGNLTPSFVSEIETTPLSAATLM
jgi:hypothetical protein